MPWKVERSILRPASAGYRELLILIVYPWRCTPPLEAVFPSSNQRSGLLRNSPMERPAAATSSAPGEGDGLKDWTWEASDVNCAEVQCLAASGPLASESSATLASHQCASGVDKAPRATWKLAHVCRCLKKCGNVSRLPRFMALVDVARSEPNERTAVARTGGVCPP